MGGKTLNIAVGNLVLVKHHPEGQVQDNSKSELFINGFRTPGPEYIYSIKPLDGIFLSVW